MCQCAAIGCKKKVRGPPFDSPGYKPVPLCYKHSWQYAATETSEYAYLHGNSCPVLTAGDVAAWLTSVGL